MDTSQPISADRAGSANSGHVGNDEADGAQQMQGLVDAAVMVVAMIVPPLCPQFRPESFAW